jgi:integrase
VHFSETQVLRLLTAARKIDPAFSDFLEGHFLCGCRPHELSAVRVKHFDPDSRQIRIPSGKTGSRDVTLTSEGVEFFRRCAQGKDADALLLPRADGKKWGTSHQTRPMKLALEAAGLPANATMYALRHSFISRAIERSMPLTLLAKNCGTSVKMIEVTYSKTLDEIRNTLIEKTAPVLRVVEKMKNTG